MTDAVIRAEAAARRRTRIRDALDTSGFLTVNDLSRELGVSHMTVRRDLHALHEAGQVRLLHGGVSPPAHGPGERADPVPSPDDGAAAGRAAVARRAAAMVDRAETVAVDAGPTGLAVATALLADFRGTVITHSMPVLRLFDDRPTAATAVALGGELLVERRAFVGPATEAALGQLRARTVFLTPVAVDERGVYAGTPAEAGVQRRLIGIADRVVLVATHEVYAASAPARVVPLDRVCGGVDSTTQSGRRDAHAAADRPQEIHCALHSVLHCAQPPETGVPASAGTAERPRTGGP